MYNHRNLAVLILAVSLLMLLPSVDAQTTRITGLRHASYAVAGSLDPLIVTATVSYQDAKPGYSLVVGISDLNVKPSKIISGIAMSSPDRCVNEPVLAALCIVKTTGSSGSENLEFRIGGILDEPRGPGYWGLNITAALVTENNAVVPGSESSIPFEINLTPIILTIKVPLGVVVSVDGVANPPGPAQVPVAIGQHTIMVPVLAEVDEGTRLKFDHWTDGFIEPNRTIQLRTSGTYEVVYITQYRLAFAGQAMTAIGEDWYDKGSLATFSVATTEPMGGILGILGGRLTFQGWYENGELIAKTATGSIAMDKPHTLTVRWQEDYTTPGLVLIAIIIIIGLVYFGLRKRTSQSPVTPPRRPQPRTSRKRDRSR